MINKPIDLPDESPVTAQRATQIRQWLTARGHKNMSKVALATIAELRKAITDLHGNEAEYRRVVGR